MRTLTCEDSIIRERQLFISDLVVCSFVELFTSEERWGGNVGNWSSRIVLSIAVGAHTCKFSSYVCRASRIFRVCVYTGYNDRNDSTV